MHVNPSLLSGVNWQLGRLALWHGVYLAIGWFEFDVQYHVYDLFGLGVLRSNVHGDGKDELRERHAVTLLSHNKFDTLSLLLLAIVWQSSGMRRGTSLQHVGFMPVKFWR